MVWGFSLLALLPALAEAARLAVLRVGDGSSALNSASAPIFIDTYSTTGTLESSFAVPDLTLSGSATSEGALSLSADGQYITFAGYRVAAGTANVASSAASTVPRGIATLDRSSNYVLRAQLTGSFSGNNIRGAATVDGSKFYVVGVNSGAGMLLVNPSSPTPTTTIVASPTNIRAVTIDQGHVLFSTGSGTAGVYRVGDKNTFPTTQTASTLLAAQGSPYGMALVSEDTLFVADDSAGVVRFVKTDATFTKNQTIAGGIRGLTYAGRDATSYTFFVTSPTAISRLILPIDVNAQLPSLYGPIVTAGSNTAFRGIVFLPDSTPSTSTAVSAQATSEPATVATSATSAAATSATSATAAPTTTPGAAVKISEIQGNSWRSPKIGATVTKVRGIMIGTYVSSTYVPQGIYIQDPNPDSDARTSEGVLLYSGTSTFNAVFGSFKVGDLIEVGSAVVQEFRSSSAPETNTLTQLGSVKDVVLIAAKPADKSITDLVPVKELGGSEMPNAITWNGNEFGIGQPQVNLDTVTDPLTPTARGTDYFEALEFMLVKVTRPVVISKTDANGNFWVLSNRGELATGRNTRGGVTLLSENGTIDSNPERIQIVPPSVGDTTSPTTLSIGDELDDIVGVMDFAFNKWRVIPLENVKVTKSRLSEDYPSTRLEKTDCGLVVSNYNMLNLDPSDKEQVKTIAKQIAEKLRSPDIIGAQEIQDNTGETNNGVVDADQTLNLLADSIVAAGGVKYSWIQINPTNNAEGGAPGGNIRVAYLYNPLRVNLTAGTIGGTNDAQDVTADAAGKATLKYSVGRIDPSNAAWDATRRSTVASFEFRNQKLFLINNHWSSKGGSSPTFGHVQPATNGVVDKRIAQANVVRGFIDKILAIEPTAKVMSVGDLNEFAFVEPVQIMVRDGKLVDLMEAKLPAVERYSYNFDGQCQALDHAIVSSCLVRTAEIEPMHVNTWFPLSMSASDHDPEVARLNFCDNDCTVVPPATSTVPATTATATVVTATSASATATATAQPIVKISEIQGNTWRSPKLGKTVTNVRGIMIGTYVTSAFAPQGIYIQDPEADGDSLTSEGILAFSGTSSFANVFGSFKVGDLIQIGSAVVSEFRSSSAPFTNTLTQLTTVRNVTLLQARPADKVVTDLISPKELGQLDMPNVITWDGNEFAIGAPQINLDNITAPLTPTARGTDFFEALEFMLVKVPRPVAISKTDANGNFWVLANRGELATSRNARGGVTVNSENGVIDSNPERIQIVPPSVGDTTSPSTISIGDELDDIVGVLDFAFDKWRVIPLANVKITKSRLSEEYPATRLEKTDCGLVVSNYNMLNLDPSDTEQVKTIAKQIAEKLKSPDIIGAQEIQDNNGETNNGIVDADQTLNLLVDSIVAAGGVKYSWVQINPTNGLEGGAPGGNIRVAYLYNPLRVSLTAGTIGGTNDTQEVSAGPDGKAVLKYAAGRIDPQNPAWEATRRSAVASFEFRNQKFFLINNHWSSKGGSTPTYGHLQPATNGVVDKRIAQANVVRAFIDKILAIEPTAKIMSVGDLNEYAFVEPVQIIVRDGKMVDLMDAKLPVVERYSYNFDGQCQALDHAIVSSCLVRTAEIEPMHVNTWFPLSLSASDHDPEVALLNFCDNDCGSIEPPISSSTSTSEPTTTIVATGTSTAVTTSSPAAATTSDASASDIPTSSDILSATASEATATSVSEAPTSSATAAETSPGVSTTKSEATTDVSATTSVSTEPTTQVTAATSATESDATTSAGSTSQIDTASNSPAATSTITAATTDSGVSSTESSPCTTTTIPTATVSEAETSSPISEAATTTSVVTSDGSVTTSPCTTTTSAVVSTTTPAISGEASSTTNYTTATSLASSPAVSGDASTPAVSSTPCTTTTADAASTPVVSGDASTAISTPTTAADATSTPVVSGDASTPISTPCTTIVVTSTPNVSGAESTPGGYATSTPAAEGGDSTTPTNGGYPTSSPDLGGEESTPSTPCDHTDGNVEGASTADSYPTGGDSYATTSFPVDAANSTPAVNGGSEETPCASSAAVEGEGEGTPAYGDESTPSPKSTDQAESAYLSSGDSSALLPTIFGAMGGALVFVGAAVGAAFAMRRRTARRGISAA